MLLTLVLAGCSLGDDAAAPAAMRQGFRAVTQLIRTAVPAPQPEAAITVGVRG